MSNECIVNKCDTCKCKERCQHEDRIYERGVTECKDYQLLPQPTAGDNFVAGFIMLLIIIIILSIL